MLDIRSSQCSFDKAPLSLDKKYTLVEMISSYGTFMDITVKGVHYRIVYQTDDLETAKAWVQQSPKYNAYFTTDVPEVKEHVEWTIKAWKEDEEPWFEIFKPETRESVINAFLDLGVPKKLAEHDADSPYYKDVWFLTVGKDRKRVVLETKGKKSVPSGFKDSIVKVFTINSGEHAVGRKSRAVTLGNKGYIHLWNLAALEELDYVLWD